MIPTCESVALLALMAVLVADHGIGVRLGVVADALVAGVGVATYVGDVQLSAPVAALWLVAAAAAGDQVARLGGGPPRRDPLGLLARARTAGTYAAASLVAAATWIVGLVLVGRVAAGVVLA